MAVAPLDQLHTHQPPAHVRLVQEALVAWYRQAGRPLPWRQTRDAYAVLVSEMMLQQTQVDRVIPSWHAWLGRFPTLQALAAATRADAIRQWSGLGYNLRAVRLHEIAREAVERWGGRLPDTQQGLLALKGVGPYTAAAVACFAFARPVAMVDTNVRRVLARVFLGQPRAAPGEERTIQALASAVLPAHCAYEWNQALMDLGAGICTVHRPACLVCPLLDLCAAAPAMGAWPAERQRRLQEARAAYEPVARHRADRHRQRRGRVVAALRALAPGEALALDELGPRIEAEFSAADLRWLDELVRKLAVEGLVVLEPAPAAGAAATPTGDPPRPGQGQGQADRPRARLP